MSELPLNQILCGNCVEVLKDFPDNSIDLVVTDPPYGLSFMGKDWDKTLPPLEAFDEIIRVLKPGALAFVMSSPRQDLLWRMLSMLEGVGFELTQSYIDWIYKTGFPKAYDVSKGIDRRKGGLIDGEKLGAFIKKHRNNAGLTIYEAGKLIAGNKSAAFCNWETGYNLPSPALWLKIKEIIKAPNSEWDNKLIEAYREKTGESKNHISWYENELPFEITRASTNLAKKWDGWKSQTGLKPAHEPILMVNKPFSEKTIVDNVLKWGTGAINVDACRIPFGENPPKEMVGQGYASLMKSNVEQGFRPKDYYEEQNGFEYNPSNKGRFPANLLVSDKALDTGEITQSPSSYISENVHAYGKGIGEPKGKFSLNYGDEGGASRYFDLDAWAKHHGFLDVSKPDNKERDFGLKGKKNVPKSKFNLSDGSKDMRFDGVVPTPRRNVHPTVKPIKLMAYLIELGCPPDGVVLDPFVGSGTTCIAAKRLARKYIGIEINPEYHRMAEARISAYPVPLSWFSRSETEDVLVPPISREEVDR